MKFSELIIKNKDQHGMWIDSCYMRYGLKKGTLSKLLTMFDFELIGTGKEHNTLEEYKKHFFYWLGDQDRKRALSEYKNKRVGML